MTEAPSMMLLPAVARNSKPILCATVLDDSGAVVEIVRPGVGPSMVSMVIWEALTVDP